jgi:hypothetical protein
MKPERILPSTRRYRFVDFAGRHAGDVLDNNSRAVDAVCLQFSKQICRAWSGYMHFMGRSGRVYAVTIAPGSLPWCRWVAKGDQFLHEPRKRRTQAQIKADGLPRTILDDVREALPMVGQIFYPKSLAQRLSEKTGSKLHVNAVLPELNILRDHRKVRPVTPKLRHGQREPALQDRAWLRVG